MENTTNQNTVTSSASKSITSNNTKLIITISAIVAVIIMIIAVVTIKVLNSHDEPDAAEADITTTQNSDIATTQENETTTQSKNMVPLISLCPTYEEFMNKLSSGVTDLTETQTDSGKIDATFSYNGHNVTVFYSESTPHYINSIMVMDFTTSYSTSWVNSCMAGGLTILQLYLEDVPNSDSSETISGKYADGLTYNTAQKESDGTTLKMSDSYTNHGITYSYSSLMTPYTASHSQSVEIDESYEIETEDDTDTTVQEKETTGSSSTTEKSIANSKYLIDSAKLFNDKEKDSINEKLKVIRNNYSFDVVILTTNTFDGKMVDDYADDYYTNHGYGNDGCILVLNMSNREWYIAAYGNGKGVIDSDSADKTISDQILPKLKENKYFDAMLDFINQVEKLIN